MTVFKDSAMEECKSDSCTPADTPLLRPALITTAGAFIRKVVGRLDARFPFTLSVKILALVCVLSWYALYPVRFTSVSDPDLGWHIRSGEWIVQHHHLPRVDPFSITGAGKPWIAYSWSFGLFAYELAKNFDLLGLAAYTLLAWMGMVGAVFVLARGQGASFWRAWSLSLISGVILQRVVSPRPGTLTILFFILLFHLLLQDRSKAHTTRAIWIAPVIIWLWANVHVQFVYGLFIIGLFCIEPVLDRVFLGAERAARFSPRLWIILAVSVAVTFLNPYGFGPYKVLLDFVRQPMLAHYVMETSAMSFTLPLHFFVLLLTLGAAFVLAARDRARPLWVILLLWSAYSGFRMERDIWLVATVAVAMIAGNSARSERLPESPRLWVYGLVGVMLVTLVMLKRVPTNKELLGLIATKYPVGAVAYLHEHHLSGPIFNDYDWGGFLIYAMPEMPVAIDGRTNIHGEDEVGRSLNTWSLRAGWDSDPLLNNANLVFGSPLKALTNHLRTDTHFKVAFDDGVCVLFQRIAPGTLEVKQPEIKH